MIHVFAAVDFHQLEYRQAVYCRNEETGGGHRILNANLSENFCIQETVKLFFHQGRRPNLCFLRTQNPLGADLLIEESFQTLILVELKMTETPHSTTGAAIGRFRKLFADWNIKPGMIVSLVDQSVPLSDVLSATTIPDYPSMKNSIVAPQHWKYFRDTHSLNRERILVSDFENMGPGGALRLYRRFRHGCEHGCG